MTQHSPGVDGAMKVAEEAEIFRCVFALLAAQPGIDVVYLSREDSRLVKAIHYKLHVRQKLHKPVGHSKGCITDLRIRLSHKAMSFPGKPHHGCFALGK